MKRKSNNVKSIFPDIADERESWVMIKVEQFDFNLFRHRSCVFELRYL